VTAGSDQFVRSFYQSKKASQDEVLPSSHLWHFKNKESQKIEGQLPLLSFDGRKLN